MVVDGTLARLVEEIDDLGIVAPLRPSYKHSGCQDCVRMYCAYTHDSSILHSLAEKILGPEYPSFGPGIAAIPPQTMNKDNATNINCLLASFSRLQWM